MNFKKRTTQKQQLPWFKENRNKVRPADFAPRGKYRGKVYLLPPTITLLTVSGICKMFRVNPDGEQFGGTASGWLIAPDIVVTAAHCVYQGFPNARYKSIARATSILVCIGYNGTESMGDEGVEQRWGKRVAVPTPWTRHEWGHYDVAFIHLEKPFDTGAVISYAPTPLSGKEILGVVGYQKDGEEGEHMFENFDHVWYDLNMNNGILGHTLWLSYGKHS